MANPMLENPIVAAAIHDLRGRPDDVALVQHLLDRVRAEIAENAAGLAEAVARRALARRHLMEALLHAAAAAAAAAAAGGGSAPPEPAPEPGKDGGEALALEPPVESDPEVDARWAEYAGAVARVAQLRELERVLIQALGFLVLARAAAFAVNRAPLLLGVLATVAAACALAYTASGGAVVPGTASLLRISVLVLCFLFGLCG
ncbi:hypothetical protein ACP4OV_006424 [Aristida adscensionis]